MNLDKRKAKILFLILLIISAVSLFYFFRTSNINKQLATSQEEISVWASSNNIKVLKYMELNKEQPYVLFLYETGDEIGIYLVESIKNKPVYKNAMKTAKNSNPVQVLGIRTGVPVVFLVINDQELLTNGDKLEIMIGRERIVENIDSNNKSYGITYDSNEDFSEQNITIFDSEQNILFENFEKVEVGRGVDLYQLYFGLASKEIVNGLSANELETSKREVDKFNMGKKLKEKSIGIFDLWLYTKILSLNNSTIDLSDEISNYLQLLKSEQGYYLSYLEEDSTNQPGTSYLLTTKMAFEIYETIERPFFKHDETKSWLKSVYNEIKNQASFDPITTGDYVGMLESINEKFYKNINEKIITDKELFGIFNEIKEELVNSEMNIDKIDTVLSLRNFFQFNESELKEEFLSYMQGVQLANGSFPIYGVKNENPDIFTTYLFLKNANELEIQIPQEDKLLLYINESTNIY